MASLFAHSTQSGAADFQSNVHLPVRQNPNLSTSCNNSWQHKTAFKTIDNIKQHSTTLKRYKNTII